MVSSCSPWLCECILDRRNTRSNDRLPILITNTYFPLISVLMCSSILQNGILFGGSTPALAAGVRVGRASFSGAFMPRDDIEVWWLVQKRLCHERR